MPPAAIGAAFVAAGASAATAAAAVTIVTAVYVGAAIGAVVGAATSLVTGGNILEGALKGAVIGGLTKGIFAGFGVAAGAGATAAEGVGEAGLSAAGESTLDPALIGEVGSTGGVGGANATSVSTGTMQSIAAQTGAAAPATGAETSKGLLSGVANWIEKNPNQASLVGQGVGGAAKAMAEQRTSDREIEALMERDRLNRDAIKVRGLNTIDFKTVLPTISGFLEKPKWQMPQSGLLWEGLNANAKTANA